MKKILLILLLLLVGCQKEDTFEISYDDSYYQVANPYKESIGSYSIRSYDKENVEIMLSNLSKEYFKVNNSLYQEGQFFIIVEIKKLVDEYNQTEEIKIDDVVITPSYITTIYEQNYLATNNNLKGISLAIVVNNKQYYEENRYKIIDEKTVLDYALSKANNLVSYMRNKDGMQNINIVVGIYLENDLKGSFKYLGSTTTDKIDLKYVNYSYYLLESNYVMTNDNKTYNNIIALKNKLQDYNVYFNSFGLYQDKILNEVKIDIKKSYFRRSEILHMTNVIINNINNFNDVSIKVYFKSNNQIKAFLNKNNNATKIETYILED